VTVSGAPCPLCGGTSFEPRFQGRDRLYRTTPREFTLAACTSCELLQLHPRPTPGELGAFYPDHYWFQPGGGRVSALEEWYRRQVLRDHVRVVERAWRASPGGPLLDVGCGGALLARLLRKRGVPALGLDWSHAAARVAWHTNGVPVLRGDLLQAPFRPASLSVLTMFHVLEHVFDPAGFLRHAHQLLAPGGRLVVQVPNAASFQFLLFGDAWNGLDVPRHLWNFRARDLNSLVTQCGFEVVREKHFSLRDNPAGLATTLAPGLDPMARRLRQTPESPQGRLLRNLVYLALVGASVPPTLFEAACRFGSTITIEGRKPA